MTTVNNTTTETATVQMPLLQHHYELAYRAHCGTSFSPERRAASIVREYSTQLTEDLAGMAEELRAEYQRKYESFLTSWLHAKSRCISSMITGPARFPVARARKYNSWEENAYNKFQTWRTRALSAIARSVRKLTQGTELQEANKNLASCKHNHELMKKCNAIIRKAKGDKELAVKSLVEGGIKPELAHELMHAPHHRGNGFAQFYLTNNLANIKRLESRVKELEVKEARAKESDKTQFERMINGVRVFDNYEADRTQIFFDGKPERKVIEALKSEGWRWSPSANAWQRKLTRMAGYSAEGIIKQNIPAPEVTEAMPIAVEVAEDNETIEAVFAEPTDSTEYTDNTPAAFVLQMAKVIKKQAMPALEMHSYAIPLWSHC